MPRLARVESLLGAFPSDVDESALDRLVTGAVREDQDLEFKQQLYGASDGSKRDLAGDVAALANTVGGLLVIGVRDVDGVVAGLAPVELSEGEELRMRQIVASLVAPHPSMKVHRVVSRADADRGYYLLEVPRSPLAPHAVRVNDALRYPKRDGAGIRWLAESEVADAYRNRFAAARDQTERVAAIRRDGEAALPDLGGYAWLSLAITPAAPGEMPLTQQAVHDLRTFRDIVPMPVLAASHLRDAYVGSRAGYRRVVLLLGPDDSGRPRDGVLHLHVDGSGFVGVKVGRELRNQATGEGAGVVHVSDELLTQEVVNAVSILVHHAVNNCGATGEALVEATIVSGMTMQLGQSRGFAGDRWGREIEEAPVGRHTVDLDEIVGTGRGLIVAARMVINDLVQGFGLAESPQLSNTGALRIRYFAQPHHGQLRVQAGNLGLDITEETL
jgi:hypothetical protein